MNLSIFIEFFGNSDPAESAGSVAGGIWTAISICFALLKCIEILPVRAPDPAPRERKPGNGKYGQMRLETRPGRRGRNPRVVTPQAKKCRYPLRIVARRLRATLSPMASGEPATSPVSVSSTCVASLTKGFASFPFLKAPA